MRTLLLTAAIFALAAPALAGTAVTLRSDTADADGRVTLSDLFDGAGAAGDTLVAMRPGPTAVLEAGVVQLVARRAGLDWNNPTGLRRIIVRGGSSPAANAPAQRGGVEVLTWARSMNAGEVVQASDLTYAKLAGAPADAAQDSDTLVGMEVRRPLRTGAAASMRDVSAPLVIKRDDVVAVTYADGGITLTLQAKAMGPAAMGQVFTLQNITSKKTIQAVAQGPGQAITGPQAAVRSTQRFAAR